MSSVDFSKMSKDEIIAYAMKLQEAQSRKVSMSVSDAGYIEVYGLPGKGRFSISLPPEGWDTCFKLKDSISDFVQANRAIADARFTAYKAQAQAKPKARAIG